MQFGAAVHSGPDNKTVSLHFLGAWMNNKADPNVTEWRNPNDWKILYQIGRTDREMGRRWSSWSWLDRRSAVWQFITS